MAKPDMLPRVTDSINSHDMYPCCHTTTGQMNPLTQEHKVQKAHTCKGTTYSHHPPRIQVTKSCC